MIEEQVQEDPLCGIHAQLISTIWISTFKDIKCPCLFIFMLTYKIFRSHHTICDNPSICKMCL